MTIKIDLDSVDEKDAVRLIKGGFLSDEDCNTLIERLGLEPMPKRMTFLVSCEWRPSDWLDMGLEYDEGDDSWYTLGHKVEGDTMHERAVNFLHLQNDWYSGNIVTMMSDWEIFNHIGQKVKVYYGDDLIYDSEENDG